MFSTERDLNIKHREEVERLQAQIDVLKEQLEMKLEKIEHYFEFSRMEGRCFLSIWNKKMASTSDLLAAMYFDRDEPEHDNTDVYIWRVRQKVKRFGIKILCRWRQGFYFDDASRVIIKSIMEELN